MTKRKRMFSVLLPLFFVLSSFSLQAGQQDKPIIKVNVDLRIVPVVVVGDNGKLKSDLKESNFSVKLCASDSETVRGKNSKKRVGQQHCIDYQIFDKEIMPPGRFLFEIDESGSAKEYLERFSKPATIRMIKELLSGENNGLAKSENKYMLKSFYEKPRNLVSPWSGDILAAKKALETVHAGGNSAIFDTLYLAAKLEMLPIKGYTKVIIMITDGMDTFRSNLYDEETNNVCPEEKRGAAATTCRQLTCRQLKKEDVVYALQESQTVLYVIDSRPSPEKILSSFQKPLNTAEDLGEIAKLSGGERFLVKNIAGAEKAAKSILEIIGKRYLFGFYTSSLPCGWYDIKVAIGEKKNDVFKVNKRLTENAVYPQRWWICNDETHRGAHE